MKQLLRKILLGDIPVREYATVTVNTAISEMVMLNAGNTSMDISSNHWLLCLDPVIFGIWLPSKEAALLHDKQQVYKMYFKDAKKHPVTIATLDLVFFNSIEEPDGTLLLLKLKKATSNHISFIKTQFLFHRHYKKPGVDLKKIKSFAAAYSYPRRVRLISFKDGEYFNIFPMDLVGDIPQSDHYVFGLRHTNVTLARMIETKKITVSEVPYEYKDLIYELGKHHRGPVSIHAQSIDFVQGEVFGFPVPAWANSYKEIEIQSTLNLGSHMLLWGKEVNEKKLTAATGHLFHIHFLHYLHQQKKGIAYPLV